MSIAMITASAILILAIFYTAFRFANRARRVNTELREARQKYGNEDTA